MNHKTSLWVGSMIAALTMGTNATAATAAGTDDKGYCTIPYLYATNIRAACEQLGANGLSGLFDGSRMFDQMLNRPHIADVNPAPAPQRTRS